MALILLFFIHNLLLHPLYVGALCPFLVAWFLVSFLVTPLPDEVDGIYLVLTSSVHSYVHPSILSVHPPRTIRPI